MTRAILLASAGSLIACAAAPASRGDRPEPIDSGEAPTVPTAPTAPTARSLAPSAPGTEAPPRPDSPLRPRADFSARLGTLRPGMTAAHVRDLLGDPDDIRTETDPGGIAAARTVEVWRWGTNGHLTFGTLGTVHIQADDTIQYVFGGSGSPPPAGMFEETELRGLLRLLAHVPSYNAPLHPLRLIQAVNALQSLGKDRALAVVDEYLRVSSWLDDDGREGVFLVLRTLFDVPATPGHLPHMMVGAPAPAAPEDPTVAPRFPLVLVDDIPLKVVRGYMLAGKAESPEMHIEWYREHGVVRSAPLRPPSAPLEALHRVAGAPGAPLLTRLRLTEAELPYLYDQVLALVETVYATERDSFGSRFSHGDDAAARWRAHRERFAALAVTWSETKGAYTFADGSTLPPTGRPPVRRALWDIPVAGPAKARVALERRFERWVDVEVRVTVPAGAHTPGLHVRIVDAATGDLYSAFALPTVVGSSTSVHSQTMELPAGTRLRVEVRSDARELGRSPALIP